MDLLAIKWPLQSMLLFLAVLAKDQDSKSASDIKSLYLM